MFRRWRKLYYWKWYVAWERNLIEISVSWDIPTDQLCILLGCPHNESAFAISQKDCWNLRVSWMRRGIWLNDSLFYLIIFLHDDNVASWKRDNFVLQIYKDVVTLIQSIPTQNSWNLQGNSAFIITFDALFIFYPLSFTIHLFDFFVEQFSRNILVVWIFSDWIDIPSLFSPQ